MRVAHGCGSRSCAPRRTFGRRARAGAVAPAGVRVAGATRAGVLLTLAFAAAAQAIEPLPADPSDTITRAIERRPPARAPSAAARVDETSLTVSDLDRLAGESRARWAASRHGPMLMRILPERVQPSQLPDAGSRGARLTALYCVQCHHLPVPAMHDAASWPAIVRRMVPRMEGRGNLGPLMADLMRAPGAGERALAAPDAEEAREIVAYLRRHAQRGLDPDARPALAEALGHGSGRTFADACSQCHVLPDPAQHTADEWPRVVERMQRNLQWMNRVVGGRPDAREPQLSVPEIVGFLQRHARR